MHDPDIPTPEELCRLPLRALCAFTARCAYRVLALYDHDDPFLDTDVKAGVIGASLTAKGKVSAAVQSHLGGNGKFVERMAHIAARCEDGSSQYWCVIASSQALLTAAGVVALQTQAIPESGRAQILEHGHAAAVAAYSAVAATHALGKDAAEMCKAAMRWDYDLLLQAATAEGWQDETAVPQEFFGSEWPNGCPSGWPRPDEPSGDATLLLEFQIPEDATEEEILALTKDVISAADDLHRAHGGHGLEVKSLEITTDVPEPAGVRQ